MTARVFTIPPSAPFLRTLIMAMMDGRLDVAPAADPLVLAATTLYLPTRRAGRLLRDAFLETFDGKAMILPRIVALGDIDEDEFALADPTDAATGDLAAALALPEAIGARERCLLLASLVMKWAATPGVKAAGGNPLIAQTPAAAYALAEDLARLIDDMTLRAVPWSALDDLVPDEFDQYWELTLRFLKEVIHDGWNDALKVLGKSEPAARRDALIKAEAARLAAKSDGPVIVAGSTGSIPSTADLIATVARLPHGAVVLPGLDTELDERSWRLIAGDEEKRIAAAPGHPQFALSALLQRIGITRDAVVALAPSSGRERLVSEVLRPAAATEMWREKSADRSFAHDVAQALGAVTMIEAAHPEEEALAIAVVLREAVEAGKTASLVTPDRSLGRRVVAALGRWDIEAEDSAGEPLATTPAGAFARLAATVALEGTPPVPLLALLKHPALRLGSDPHSLAVEALERAVLRGPRPRAGCAALAQALAHFREQHAKARRGEPSDLHRSDPRLGLSEHELDAAAALVHRLRGALAPLETMPSGKQPLGEFASRHRAVIAALSIRPSDATPRVDDEKLAEVLDELATSETAGQLRIDGADYIELFTTMLAGGVVRRPATTGRRVQILGLLEARLTQSDRVVLGGLVEGTWPPEGRADAWLNRPMRLKLGLDLPERRIGLTAHDFAQLFGAPEIVLTRAAKIGGAPTVPSRFVQRLAAVAGSRWTEATARGSTYLAWARSLDHADTVKPERAPAPTPPVEARPQSLSVTEIEDWLRDPYTIYARHILKLSPLDEIDMEPGASDRGSIFHRAIGDFTEHYPETLPADAERVLLELAQPHFARLSDFPEVEAFWRPRFERIAHWFVDFERRRRLAARSIKAERRGEIEIPLPGGVFKLRGVADRIEQLADGAYAILDYKTGAARSAPQVQTGFAPQLPLEAAILRHGGFADIASGSIAEFVYVLLKGGEPAGKVEPVKLKDTTPDDEADKAYERLRELATRFADARTPYRALVHPMWTTHYGTYDHLARVKEWSSTGGETDQVGGPE
jgi:ATP-dependent helicase/nuclease subunit B